MSTDRRAGDEPIPGYVLVEPLGRGGFGEVWKCVAPGGLHKAVKFVPAGGDQLRQEAAAFERVHPDELELVVAERRPGVHHPVRANVHRHDHQVHPTDALVEHAPGVVVIPTGYVRVDVRDQREAAE